MGEVNNMNNSKAKSDFKPYVAADKSPLEFTLTSILIGALLSIIFGAANAYLGLRVGMTVSASIPAAVISMSIIRILLKRDSILENNMVQTIGSAGECVAAGAIFTIPTLFMWAHEWKTATPSMFFIAAVAFFGGVLGIMFMVPLRRALIVEEHGVLTYPEGTACAEILLIGEKDPGKAKKLFVGIGLGGIVKILSDLFKFFPSQIEYGFTSLKGAMVGMGISPSLISVGFICGYRVSAIMFAGAMVSWLVIMPIMVFFGDTTVIYPAKVPLNQMGPWDLWSNYIRYIGAGCLTAGGIISMIKIIPMIVRMMKDTLGSISGSNGVLRTERDLPIHVVGLCILAVAVALFALPLLKLDLLCTLLIIVLGFFFACAGARIVGLVGASNNPVSGMTIACLLFINVLFLVLGRTDHAALVSAMTIAGVLAIIIAISADTSQDLKTGFILGATPIKQQYGMIIGVSVASVVIGAIIYILDEAWGLGSAQLAAPQAMLMKMVTEGVTSGNLPWGLVFIGVCLALMAEILELPVLAFAIGAYLPIHTSMGIFLGGLIRKYFEAAAAKRGVTDFENDEAISNNILISSGMIAGEGIIGIALALLAVLNLDFDMSQYLNLGIAGSLSATAILIGAFFLCSRDKEK